LSHCIPNGKYCSQALCHDIAMSCYSMAQQHFTDMISQPIHDQHDQIFATASLPHVYFPDRTVLPVSSEHTANSELNLAS